MKVTILGCGSSGGVPLIGNNWGECDPKDPRNRRLRASIFVEQGNTKLLVDTSPDMRQQMLANDIREITAALYTHAHADHCHGIDDLRDFNWLTQKPVDIYADTATMKELEERFSYILGREAAQNNFYKPVIQPHVIDGVFQINGVEVMPIIQDHGRSASLGFRFADFAYSTDVKRLDDAAFEALKGVKVWAVDCIRDTPHPTHSHLEQTLEWIARVKPERAYLTHMSHVMDYAATAAKLPPGVWPAHDGLVIEC